MASSAVATAFVPIAHEHRPLAPTADRQAGFIADHPHPKTTDVAAQVGLHILSHTEDGFLGFATAAQSDAPANLAPVFAGEQALETVRALAPELGVAASDLELGHVSALEGFTTVMIEQRYHGLRVMDGHVMVSFNGGRMVLVRNDLVRTQIQTQPEFQKSEAVRSGHDWSIRFAADARPTSEAELVIWAGGDDVRLAWRLDYQGFAPRTELALYLDALTGEALAADDSVRYADGEGRLRLVVDTLHPDSGTAPFTAVGVDLGASNTDGDGWAQPSGSVSFGYSGPWVDVRDQAQGAEDLQANFTGPHQVIDVNANTLSQADPFVHLNIVKEWALQLTPNSSWVSSRLRCNVNINDTCNAYWDGQTVNFFRAGGGCNNTARLSGVVYHEFGHGYHQSLTNRMNGSVGEGIGDYIAATITDAPVVGEGFSTNGNGIRRIDRDAVYPDDLQGQVHQDGLIWGSSWWDLRTAMIEKLGPVEGRRAVDQMFVRAVAEGPSLTTAYPAVLAGDDDDGTLSNGTPHSCEINAAFQAHGLIDGGRNNHQVAPTGGWARINPVNSGVFVPSDTGDVSITASVENRSSCGTVDASALVIHVAQGMEPNYTPQPTIAGVAGQQVVLSGLEPGTTFRYWFEIEADGRTFTLGSATQPFVGVVDAGWESLWAEDFESGLAAWNHETIGSDLVDDWEANTPRGLRFDPEFARGGSNVVGTDLGGEGGFGGTDGAAHAGRNSKLEPLMPVSTEGYENIAVQFWLHTALSGSFVAFVNEAEVFRFNDTGTPSDHWTLIHLPLGETAADNPEVFLRFEVQTSNGERIGGVAMDDVSVIGVEIPPPPPPPPPPPVKQDPEDPEMPETPELPEIPDPEPNNPVLELNRGQLGGGCACSADSVVTGEAPLAFLALGLLLGLRRRRR